MKPVFALLLLGSLGTNAFFLISANESKKSVISSPTEKSNSDAYCPQPESLANTHHHNEEGDLHTTESKTKFLSSDMPDLSLKDAEGDIEVWLSSKAKLFFQNNPDSNYYQLYEHLSELTLAEISKKQLSVEDVMHSLSQLDDNDIADSLVFALAEAGNSNQVQEMAMEMYMEGDARSKKRALEIIVQTPTLTENTISTLTEQVSQVGLDSEMINDVIQALPVNQRISPSLEGQIVKQLTQIIKDNPGSSLHLSSLPPLAFYSRTESDLIPLLESLSHPEEAIRARAAFALGSVIIKSERVKQQLLSVLKYDKSNNVKDMAWDSLKSYSLNEKEYTILVNYKPLASK